MTKAETKNLIGECCLILNEVNLNEAELGCILAPEYWGQRLSFEVADLLIKFGFNDLNLDQVFGVGATKNSPSIKVMKKMGGVEQERYLEEHALRGETLEKVKYVLKNPAKL